ncbi:unnamed protein product [Ambrosiozyma monospora]|uniref:Unnamed protein product n=1 Tax=Ambrosiozyma monospora TaxID=43982 RepID=A0ACB5SW44_AMBMO|nr:unnamed protein product [Ambrosiozyma monospora]
MPFLKLADYLKIATKLPFEIQCLVLKHIILNRLNKLKVYNTYSDELSTQIFALIGHNEYLDNIMSVVIQELKLSHTFFHSRYFNEIAEFIISRSIPIKDIFIYADDRTIENLSSSALSLIQFCQSLSMACHCHSQSTWIAGMANFTRLTSMSIQINDLRNIWFANCFKQFPQLTKLKLNITLPYDRHSNFLNDVLSDWKRHCPVGEERSLRQRSLSLNLQQTDDVVQDIFDLNITSLNDVVSKNKTDFRISLSLDVAGQPLESSAHLNDLISSCDIVEKMNITISNYLSDTITWINSVSDARSLKIYFGTPTRGLKLAFGRMDFLRSLFLVGCKVNPSIIEYLPDTLESLDVALRRCTNKNSVMKLPSHLRCLTIEISSYFPELSNVKDLLQLANVSIYNSVEDENPFIDFKLVQLSISRLPSNVSNLRINGRSKFQTAELQTVTSTEKLFFGSMPELKRLDFKVDMIQVDLGSSSFPSLKKLRLPSYSVDDQLPNSLETLDTNLFVDRGTPATEVSRFWERYISPLDNLLKLSLGMNGSQDIDLRNVRFPPHLSHLKVTYKYANKTGSRNGRILIKQKLPKVLRYFEVTAADFQTHEIVVFGGSEKDTENMKNRFFIDFPDQLIWTFKAEGN